MLSVLLVPAAIGAVDSDWQEERRDVTFQQTGSGATATSRGDGDRIELDFDAATGAIDYVFTDTGDGTILRLEHRVAGLIEWQDLDGDGRYSLGDRTVHRTSLQDATHTVSSQESSDGHRVEARYTILGEAADGDPLDDPDVPTGTFTIAFDVLERTIQRDGATITPTEVPIVLSTQDFPFREDGTELAFEVRLRSDTALDRTGGDQPVATTRQNHTTFYSWSPEATIDGQTVAGRVTELVRSPLEPTGAGVYHAFARGDVAQHARMGTSREATVLPDMLPRLLPEGDAALFAAGALLMAGIVGVPAVQKMRRRR